MAAYAAEDVATWLLGLRPKIQSIFEKNSTYGVDDVRYVTFNGFNAMIEHFIMIHKMLSAFEKGIVDDEEAKKIFGFTIKDPNYADSIENMGKYEKIAFAVLVNFNAEVFSKVILQGLQNDGSDGFHSIVKSLVTELGLPDAKNKIRDMNTIASIRNALHSGGVHTRPDIPPYQIGSYTFQFRKGNPVECATWPHLIAAFERMMDILDEISKHERVQSLNTLPWQYIPR